jgi:acetate kinase
VCFDTAFHRRLPDVAQRLAVDDAWWERGVRRYGFHGLSYEHLVETVPGARDGRVVLAHLGSGASMAALHDGAPRDTTMGLTPTGGLVMGTRTGDLDPGVLLYMLRQGPDGDALTPTGALEAEVDRRGGLLGLSGTSADVRRLLAVRHADARAATAVAVFCHVARKHVGGLAAVLGGLDRLVFTGGIGANSPEVRGEVCAGLEHLGVSIDDDRNTAGAGRISTGESRCEVLAVATDEERVIARHTNALLADDRATREA